jgi:predicted nucleic acid-binding protein
MSFDPTRFAVASVVDTCAVWNMLSSLRLNEAAIQAKLHFCITPVVLYECLYKPRPCITWEQQELMDRLESNRAKGRFQTLECSLDDLLTISEKVPGRLGSGELSCLAAAYRIRSIAVMTDEKLARKFAVEKLNLSVETTPRLYGYLHYHLHLSDSDHDQVIDEHERFERRPLTEFFNKSYAEAMRCRLMVRASPAAIADQQAGQGV